MRAIVVKAEGGPEQLVVQEYPTPEPGGETPVVATALNRADILQRSKIPSAGMSPRLRLRNSMDKITLRMGEHRRFRIADDMPICRYIAGLLASRSASMMECQFRGL